MAGVASAAALLKDLYWAGTNPLVHESMAICARNNWQASAADVKGMAYEQWAGISDTKRVLEDVFAVLKTEAQRNKNLKMSRPRSFFEAACAKILHPSPTADGGPDQDVPGSVRLTQEDWISPLVLPLDKMGEGIFSTNSGHAVSGIDLTPLKKSSADNVAPWRPAGPDALQRMAAASVYLLLEAARDWADAGSAWCGVVFAIFGMFTNKEDGSCFISLGFCKWVALALPVVRTPKIHGTHYFHLHSETWKPVFAVANHDVTDASLYQGVPVEIVSPQQVPASLATAGVVWRQVADAMSLVPYAILSRCHWTVKELQAICRAHGISVQPLRRGKSVTRECYIVAMVGHFSPARRGKPRQRWCTGC